MPSIANRSGWFVPNCVSRIMIGEREDFHDTREPEHSQLTISATGPVANTLRKHHARNALVRATIDRMTSMRRFAARSLHGLALGVFALACTKAKEVSEAGSSSERIAVDAGPRTSARSDAAYAEQTSVAASACQPACAAGLACCNGQCVTLSNDPYNCGACGVRCPESAPFCHGRCTPRPCSVACDAGETCCGSRCCPKGKLCCLSLAGGLVPRCVDPVRGTCPGRCSQCQ
jgi:hypothetical protein